MPPKKGARIPRPCSASTVPTPSISTSVLPSQSSLLPLPGQLNLQTQPSVPAPPSARPWALNLLQETESSHFLRTHVERVALSNAYAYAVLHQPFSTTLASIDIASLGPHVWVSGLAIQAFLDGLYILPSVTPTSERFSGTVLSPVFYSQLIAEVSNDPLQRNKYNFENVREYLQRYNTSLLTADIIVPIHLPSASHWILVIIVPRSCEIMLIDSYPNKRHYEISQILLQWLRDTHDALNRPFFPALWTIISSDALPAAYWMWYHRLPTSEDFTQQTIPKLRSFMLYVLSLVDTQQTQLAALLDSDLPVQQTFYV